MQLDQSVPDRKKSMCKTDLVYFKNRELISRHCSEMKLSGFSMTETSRNILRIIY